MWLFLESDERKGPKGGVEFLFFACFIASQFFLFGARNTQIPNSNIEKPFTSSIIKHRKKNVALKRKKNGRICDSKKRKEKIEREKEKEIFEVSFC